MWSYGNIYFFGIRSVKDVFGAFVYLSSRLLLARAVVCQQPNTYNGVSSEGISYGFYQMSYFSEIFH